MPGKASRPRMPRSIATAYPRRLSRIFALTSSSPTVAAQGISSAWRTAVSASSSCAGSGAALSVQFMWVLSRRRGIGSGGRPESHSRPAPLRFWSDGEPGCLVSGVHQGNGQLPGLGNVQLHELGPSVDVEPDRAVTLSGEADRGALHLKHGRVLGDRRCCHFPLSISGPIPLFAGFVVHI